MKPCETPSQHQPRAPTSHWPFSLLHYGVLSVSFCRASHPSFFTSVPRPSPPEKPQPEALNRLSAHSLALHSLSTSSSSSSSSSSLLRDPPSPRLISKNQLPLIKRLPLPIFLDTHSCRTIRSLPRSENTRGHNGRPRATIRPLHSLRRSAGRRRDASWWKSENSSSSSGKSVKRALTLFRFLQSTHTTII